VDTLRQDFLGVTGDPSGISPWIDRLARRGVLFENAWSTSSWTLPSHVSLFTGQYPESHGVWGDGRRLPDAKRTLAELLRDRGYRTGGFWSGPYLHPAYGFAQGFDEYRECVNYRIRVSDEGAVENAAAAALRSRSGITAPRMHEAAAAWLDGVPPGEPYLLFMHYWDPHADYEPPPPYDQFLGGNYRGRITGHGVVQDRRIRADMPPEDKKRLLDLYRGEIRWTDAWIGKILRRLEKRGTAARTLVVLTADHGEEFFEKGVRGHRLNLYEPTLRVPLVLSLPGSFGGGRIVRSPASLVDVLPTVTAAADAPRPEEAQGRNLAAADANRVVFAGLENRLDAARGSRWKAVRSRDGEAEELYRLDEDPGEHTNRRETDPEEWEALRAKLDDPERARWAPDSVGLPRLDADTEAELRALGYTD